MDMYISGSPRRYPPPCPYTETDILVLIASNTRQRFEQQVPEIRKEKESAEETSHRFRREVGRPARPRQQHSWSRRSRKYARVW